MNHSVRERSHQKAGILDKAKADRRCDNGEHKHGTDHKADGGIDESQKRNMPQNIGNHAHKAVSPVEMSSMPPCSALPAEACRLGGMCNGCSKDT